MKEQQQQPTTTTKPSKLKRAVSVGKLSDEQFLHLVKKKPPAIAAATPAQKEPTAGMWTRGKCVLVPSRPSDARRALKLLRNDLY